VKMFDDSATCGELTVAIYLAVSIEYWSASVALPMALYKCVYDYDMIMI